MINLRRLKQKAKYNSILRILSDGLLKTGVKISPFYIVLEGLVQIIPEFESDKFSYFTIEYLNENDVEEIISGFHERQVISAKKLLERFKNGCKCLGIKKKGEIAAYTWFNFNKCDFVGNSFVLNKDEAYLFDAYTLIKYRGEKIAPYLRYQCYKELKKLGKTKLYSVSEALNKQSINFKKKLNARFIFFGLYVGLFRKWRFTLPLRDPNDIWRKTNHEKYVQS